MRARTGAGNRVVTGGYELSSLSPDWVTFSVSTDPIVNANAHLHKCIECVQEGVSV